jgi:hypothetical protein
MDYRNPIYTADGRINCEVNHPEFGWIPFTADPNDVAAHGRDIFSKITEVGDITPYVAPIISDADLAEQIRLQRNGLLAASDWTQLPDVPQTIKDTWATYRKELRDITLQSEFPREVVWPTKPE